MKKNIHPQYNKLKVVCSCGNKFETKSTLENSEGLLKVEICSACHPAYGSNTAKVMDTSGRVEKFKGRYNWSAAAAIEAASAPSNNK